jgi:Alpha-L-rhamnosidase N-terminal domain./Bacterial alpha-L-rhamnosidase.
MALVVADLRAEYRSDSSAVAVPRPRVSWKSVTDVDDWRQAAAELRWDADGETSVVQLEGRDAHLVDWPFEDLGPRKSGQLRVRVTGTDGAVSDWSDPLDIVAGFLAPGEWIAEFIGVAAPESPAQPALLRVEFAVQPGLRSATLYATAQGVYQVEVNGKMVDDQILKPGWTPYQYRLIHETTDISPLVREGGNAIGVTLAGGWFTESYGFQGLERPFYGEQPSFAAQLHLQYEDGTTDVVTTNENWRISTDGPLLSSGIYAGESFDARRQAPGWSNPGFDDAGWAMPGIRSVGVVPSARTSPAVRVVEEVAVQAVMTSPSGATLLDFGQNLVGRVRLRASGEAGHTITLRHAEVLEHGELGVRPLRRASATDSCTLAGTGVEEWEPQFTFHGFRYVEVQNWPGTLDPSDLVALVIHSDMKRTGWFASSNPMVDRLHENVVWGMRGNFLYLPTDCPQRDERLGWTGDIQVFAPTASYLYDCDGFLASWLTDLALEQSGGGGVPFTVPDVLRTTGTPAAAWGDAATIVPWVLHERFGDVGVLRAQFASMRAWVDQILAVAAERHLWEGHFQFGDWLDPSAPADRPEKAATAPDIVASAYLFRSTDLLVRAAELLGHNDVATRYRAIAEMVRAAWLSEYVTPSGRLVSDAQTAYALAIQFELPKDEATIQRMGDRLAWLVRRDGYRIGTGFVGTPLVQDALTATGHADAAARLLLQTENPSWLYPVTMGATTVWERWDSMLEDGSINPGEMTSFNHYALGAVADWLHRVVGGLAPLQSGYRTIDISPRPLKGLSWAETSHETPAGRASVRWELVGGSLRVSATVPANATARVSLPGREAFEVGSGVHEWIVDVAREATGPSHHSRHSSLAEIIDDQEAYLAVLEAIRTVDPTAAEEFRLRTEWVDQQPLIGDFTMWPPAVILEIDRALDALNDRRGAEGHFTPSAPRPRR